MPKCGRRAIDNNTVIFALNGEVRSSYNAPFGTENTPNCRNKIIASQLKEFIEFTDDENNQADIHDVKTPRSKGKANEGNKNEDNDTREDEETNLLRNDVEIEKKNNAKELRLKKKLKPDVHDIDSNKLKDIYMRLTEYDQRLDGAIVIHIFTEVLHSFDIDISQDNLEDLHAMFITKNGFINYEKALAFLAVDCNGTDKSSINSLTKLFNLINKKLIDSNKKIDIPNICRYFQELDRGQRGTLSKDQFKYVVNQADLPLDVESVELILSQCNNNNGQYSWLQFIKFIEKTQPQETSLYIPLAKMPIDYVKYIPKPDSGWPRMKPNENISNDKTKSDVIIDGNILNENDEFQSSVDHNIKNELNSDNEDFAQESLEVEIQEEEILQNHPWIDRFMMMTKALCKCDTSSLGYLSKSTCLNFVREYNWNYGLNIDDETIQSIINNNEDLCKGVNLKSMLRKLMMAGP